MLTTAEILLRVRDKIQDVAGTRWPDAELKRYLLDAQVYVIQKCPGRGVMQFLTLGLLAGIEQALPSNPVCRILDVLCNQAGSVRGRPIRKMSKDQLDAQRPSWTTETQTAVILYWMPVEGEPRDFLVYPPATTAAAVRVKYVNVPQSAETIEVDDAARDALIYYVVAQAWSKDATYAKGSLDYKTLFDNEIDKMMGADKLTQAAVQQRNPPR